uniref:PucR family transcriptional regulator n=1 Tax=Agathobacter sp. TaxID=2021311 RepID=UPI0040563C63
MLSAQKILNTINEIKEITKLDIVLFHINGKMIAQTMDVGEELEAIVADFALSEAEQQTYMDYQFYKVFVEQDADYIVLLKGIVENAFVIGQMAVCQIRNVILSKTENFDRNNFIQNILLGNLLTVDIFSRARRLHIEAKPRVAFVIDTGNKSTDIVMELVKNLCDLKAGDFVTSVDEHNVVLIKDVSYAAKENIDEELDEIAASLADSLHMEAMTRVRIGYGNVVEQIPDIMQSYQEAKMALEVGKVFYARMDTISYGKLGIGRLIYQLPMSLCEMFIKEVFGDTLPDILEDEEAMNTIHKFFENNLNISETARQLYVHRNTLVYRLERIQKAIGLDIRAFDDAMTFHIAVMVLAHMKHEK